MKLTRETLEEMAAVAIQMVDSTTLTDLRGMGRCVWKIVCWGRMELVFGGISTLFFMYGVK